MPWTARTFSSRHNRSLRGAGAARAARVANAVLRRTGDEGRAIRIASAAAKGGGRGIINRAGRAKK